MSNAYAEQKSESGERETALLDVVFVKVSFLDFIKVPRDNVLSCRSHDRVFRLILSHIEPGFAVPLDQVQTLSPHVPGGSKRY